MAARVAGESGRSSGTTPATDGVSAPDGARAAGDGWDEAVRAFVGYLSAELNRSEATVRAYSSDLASLREHGRRMGKRDLAQLDLAVLRSWLALQHTKRRARSTIARRASAARVFSAFAARRGFLADDVAQRLAVMRRTHALPRVLSLDEARALLSEPPAGSGGSAVDRLAAAVGLRDRAILEVLYATGIRVAELCGLDIHDVDFDRGTVRVLGKGGRQRTVPCGLPARAAVRAWLAGGRPHLAGETSGSALVLGARGGRIDQRTVRRVVHAAAERAHLSAELAPHGLRHTAATHLLAGGADLRSVQEILGHADLGTTQHYTQVNADRLRRAFEQAHPRA